MKASYFCYLGAITKFQNPIIYTIFGLVLKFAHFPVKIGLIGGGGGGKIYLFLIESLYFCYKGVQTNPFLVEFEIWQCSGQNRVNWGVGGGGGLGGSPNFSPLESYYLLYLGAHTKLQNPMKCPSGLDLKFGHFPVKIGLIGRVGGSPPKFPPCNPIIFVT